jgi:WD40 repeat protein
MQPQELTSLESRLLDPLPIPIIGQCLQKKAVMALAEDRSPEAVKLLAKALTRLKEPEIKQSILDALDKLRNQNCIDTVCEVWADTRHRDLAVLLIKKSWVASTPIDLQVITALKVSQPQMITNGGTEIVEPLLDAFKDRDSEIANRASECAIIFDQPEYQEFLCRLVIEQEHPIARQVALKAQYTPREPSQRALFYFLTEQWEKYETLDYEHSLLEKVYELSNEKLRKQIAEKVKQSGRAAWVQIIAGGRKSQRLEKMTDAEWDITLNVLNNNKQWEEMWWLAQKAPAVWSRQLLEKLNHLAWVPSIQEERLGFEKLKQLAEKNREKFSFTGRLLNYKLIHTGHIHCIREITFSPDGQILASYCRGIEGEVDTTIKLWQMSTGDLLATLTGHTRNIEEITFSPDSKLLASHDPEKIELWQVPDGKHIATLTGHTNSVSIISFSPDGKLLASGSGYYSVDQSDQIISDQTIRLWQMPDGRPLATLTGHTGSIKGISFSPDGQLLASCSDDHTIRLWQMPTGHPLATLTGHTGNINIEGITFSPDGKLLASSSNDKTTRLWQMPTGYPLATLTGHTSNVWRITFSPDSQILASRAIGNDKTIRLWQMPTGHPLATLTGHTGNIEGITFSPDGKLLASSSNDKTTRLWQMPDGYPLATLTGHEAARMGTFSPDGQLLATCDWDKTIKLWSSDVVELSRLPIQKLCQQNRERVQKILRNKEMTEEERNWLEFIQGLMDWHQRFDVEVEDTHQLISTGEFDIEIEG